MKRLILVLALALPVLFVQTSPVNAQSSGCSDYDFPNSFGGWSITDGHIDGDNIIDDGVSGTRVIDVTLTLSHPVYISDIRFQTYGTPQTETRHELIQLYDPNYPGVDPISAARYANFDVYPVLDAPVWRAKTAYFNNIATNKIRFVISEDSALLMGLDVISICSSNTVIVTITNTPTITPTPTPGPTDTPIVSLTPSNTPVVTDTPGPTSTEGPTGTATGLNNDHTGSFIFNTVAPPDQCATITNPCGAMPFPVPGFNQVSIASPTALASVTHSATLTIYPTMTAYGTPGGTPGTGTPTLTAGPGDAFESYATSISDQLNGIQMTPGLIDPNGSLIDLRNGANEIGASVGQFFAILKALQSFFLGKTGNIIAILILIAGFVITVKLLLWMLPIIRAVAMFIVGFIP